MWKKSNAKAPNVARAIERIPCVQIPKSGIGLHLKPSPFPHVYTKKRVTNMSKDTWTIIIYNNNRIYDKDMLDEMVVIQVKNMAKLEVKIMQFELQLPLQKNGCLN